VPFSGNSTKVSGLVGYQGRAKSGALTKEFAHGQILYESYFLGGFCPTLLLAALYISLFL